ncbi:MAG: sigma-70 family RNA polymerase sigma factor [Myxococcota bacterium]
MALNEDKSRILEKYGPYVRSLAVTVRKQFNHALELDELMAYGQMGLLEAAERFDAKVGANFLTFAHYRIKGAIYDGLRKMGILRGSDARAVYVGERASAYLGNLSDREQGGGNWRGSVDDDVRDISNAVTGLAMVFATSMDAMDGLHLADDQMPADQRLELEQLKKRVRAAIDRLPEKERNLLTGYYFQAKTLEEAGAAIGQSKSWASRLHARAIEQLKKMLNEEESHGGTTRRNLGGASSAAEAPRPGRHPKAQAGPK